MFGEIMVESTMNDGVGFGCSSSKGFDIVKGASMNGSSECGDCLGSLVVMSEC
jgi:hypothetical protein